SYDSEPLSWVRIAFAQCAQGKMEDCRKSYSNALTFPPHLLGGEFEIDLCVLHAQLFAAEGKLFRAEEVLGKAREVADRHGLVTEQLKARLALGEITLQHGQNAKGRTLLASLQQEAEEKGFGLISQRTKAVLAIALHRPLPKA